MLSYYRTTYFRFTSIITLSVLLFSTVGIHFVHSFFHHHHHNCTQCSHYKSLADSKQCSSLIHKKHVEYQVNQNCLICSFLKHFHIYKINPFTFLSLLALLSIFRFLFESVILKQTRFLLIPPRSPPCLSPE